MVPAVFNRLMAILVAVALVAAMSIQAIPSAKALGLTDQAINAGQHCPRMAVEHPEHGAPGTMPCKGIMPDCVKQMGCIGAPSLPARSGEVRTGAAYYTAVVYWPAAETYAGLALKPDLSPPIGG